MHVIENVSLNETEVEDMFPAQGDEGTDVQPTAAATTLAAARLGVDAAAVQWRCPNVFDVRYGSSYVATAFAGNRAIRFLSTLGDFRQGDDE